MWKRRCPLCVMHFLPVRVDHGGSHYALDFCDQCRLVWFDPGEHEAAAGRAPAPPPPHPVHDIPPSSVLTMVPPQGADSLLDVERGMPEDGWRNVPRWLVGLPAITGTAEPHNPRVTWAVAAVMAVLSLAGVFLGHELLVREWGLVPATPFRHGGLDFAASFFIHADAFHFFVNLYFLVLFGSRVEDLLGSSRFPLLLFGAALAGDLLFVLGERGSSIPSIGASGGISGVLVYFALAFPHARVRVVEWVYFEAITLDFSARAWLGLWVAFQALGAMLQSAGIEPGVNYLAHLGGAAVGLAFWLWRRD
jgi:membrane associated rhomboid family serine protease